MTESLSPEQQTVVEYSEGDIIASACPGAGKTYTVVERFIRRCQDLPHNRGVAIVSFSRVAAAEVQKRCHQRALARLLSFPHFVGTLDSFFIRYLYLPVAQARSRGRVRVLDSWESIDACVQLRGSKAVRGKGVSLDAFPYDGYAVRFDERRLRGEAVAWRMQIQNHRAEWERAAAARRQTLKDLGLRTCEDVRVALAHAARRGALDLVLRAVAARFCEVIVDEAQDCDESQVEVLGRIREAGARLVLVADVDQAIYEFRRATPGPLRELARTMHPLGIRGNRRGAPAICAVANSMIPLERADTHSVGETKDCDWPVRVIPYDPGAERQAGADFCARAAKRGCRETLLVAHRRTLALRAAGRDASSKGPGGMAVALTRSAVRVIDGGFDARARIGAVRAVELILLRRAGVQVIDQTVEDACRAEGIERRWLRGSVVTLLRAVRKRIGGRTTITVDEAVSIARAAAESLDPPAGRTWIRSTGSLFRVSATQATAMVALGRDIEIASDVVVNTVHGVKGEGADAVLFVLSDHLDDTARLLAAWRARSTEGEANRVAYVAVTRAKRLLGLAVPASLSVELGAILRERAVPFEEAPICQKDPTGRRGRPHQKAPE